MMRRAFATLLLGASIVVGAGCAPRHHYGYNREMSEQDAWEIVRRDPCRYDEYRRFAAEHKNPDKRRAVVWRLAHEGCSRERQYDQDRQYDHERGYDYDDRR